MKSKDKCGVYFFQETNEGLVKIGRSSDWDNRLKNMDNGPYELVKIHTIRTDNDLIVERLFQNYFSEKLVRKEWFKLSKEEINKICAGEYPYDIKLSIIGEDYKMKILKAIRRLKRK